MLQFAFVLCKKCLCLKCQIFLNIHDATIIFFYLPYFDSSEVSVTTEIVPRSPQVLSHFNSARFCSYSGRTHEASTVYINSLMKIWAVLPLSTDCQSMWHCMLVDVTAMCQDNSGRESRLHCWPDVAKWRVSYEERLRENGLTTLATRRLRGDQITRYLQIV